MSAEASQLDHDLYQVNFSTLLSQVNWFLRQQNIKAAGRYFAGGFLALVKILNTLASSKYKVESATDNPEVKFTLPLHPVLINVIAYSKVFSASTTSALSTFQEIGGEDLHSKNHFIKNDFILKLEHLALKADLDEAKTLNLTGDNLFQFMCYRLLVRDHFIGNLGSQSRYLLHLLCIQFLSPYLDNEDQQLNHNQDALYLCATFPNIKNKINCYFDRFTEIAKDHKDLIEETTKLEKTRNNFIMFDAELYDTLEHHAEYVTQKSREKDIIKEALHCANYNLTLLMNKLYERGIKILDLEAYINELFQYPHLNPEEIQDSNKKRLYISFNSEWEIILTKLSDISINKKKLLECLRNQLLWETEYQTHDNKVANAFSDKKDRKSEKAYVKLQKQKREAINQQYFAQKWEERFAKLGFLLSLVLSAVFTAEAYFFGKEGIDWILHTIFHVATVSPTLFIAMMTIMCVTAFFCNYFFSGNIIKAQMRKLGRHFDQDFKYFKNSNSHHKIRNIITTVFLVALIILASRPLMLMAFKSLPFGSATLPLAYIFLSLSVLASMLVMSNSVQRLLDKKAKEQQKNEQHLAMSANTVNALLAITLGFFAISCDYYRHSYFTQHTVRFITHTLHMGGLLGGALTGVGLLFSLISIFYRRWKLRKEGKEFYLKNSEVLSLAINLLIFSIAFSYTPIGWISIAALFVLGVYCLYQSIDKKYSVGEKIAAMFGILVAVASASLEAFGDFAGCLKVGFGKACSTVFAVGDFLCLCFFFLRGAAEKFPKFIRSIGNAFRRLFGCNEIEANPQPASDTDLISPSSEVSRNSSEEIIPTASSQERESKKKAESETSSEQVSSTDDGIFNSQFKEALPTERITDSFQSSDIEDESHLIAEDTITDTKSEHTTNKEDEISLSKHTKSPQIQSPPKKNSAVLQNQFGFFATSQSTQKFSTNIKTQRAKSFSTLFAVKHQKNDHDEQRQTKNQFSLAAAAA